jgi:glycosyltransferase involved in cell wall biosynthesis
MGSPDLDVAVVIPCYDEEAAIGEVVRSFAAALPAATIYVYDNNSTDATVAVARAAGAVVRREPRQGKGNVVQRMFADVEADVYVMVDGDGTYDASAAPGMVEKLANEGLDMVVGARVPEPDAEGEVYRPGHDLGNRAFTRTARLLFGSEFDDLFSGYRVMSRRFVKSFPLRSAGFEIETEITVHAVEVAAACAEVPTAYGARKAESASKLRTYRDGARILRVAIGLFRDLRPMRFFGSLFVLFTLAALLLGIPVVLDYVDTGLVPRFPTAILASALQILAIVFLTCGILLDSVSRSRREARKLAYLSIPPPPISDEPG